MKFLVLQHVPHEHPGRIARCAENEGIVLNIAELWKQHPIPSLDRYDALIVMGGPMGVYDDAKTFPTKHEEILSIREALSLKKPVLGICLGSQLLAHALGARVHPNVLHGRLVKEIGFSSVDLTADGADSLLFRGFRSPLRVLQWHGDAFDVPQGAQLLATAPLCRNQAFSHGTAFGTLFHVEFTPDMVERQIAIDTQWIHADHEMDEEALRRDAYRTATLMEKSCSRLFSNFVSVLPQPKAA